MAADQIEDDVCRTLATFRFELRQFLAFSDRAARRSGLTPKQHQALLAIRAGGSDMRIGDLARRLLLRPHSTTELVDRLEKLGLVARIPDRADARRVIVRLTLLGDAQLAALSGAHHAELRRLKPVLGELIARL